MKTFLPESLFQCLQLFKKKTQNRSSHQRCSIIKGVLKDFAKFTKKTPVPDSLFNKVAVAVFNKVYLKRDSGTGVFQRNLRNFQKYFFTEHFWTTAKMHSSKIPT